MSTSRGALSLLTLIGALFFADLVLHPDQTLYSDRSDLFPLHLSSKYFLIRSWRETGEVPLWQPYNFAGMPFVHDIQVSAFYPLHWPLFFVPEEKLGAALSWLVVFHVIAAGWTMHALARHHGLKGAGALVAALGYMLAGKWLLHVLAGGHYNMVPLAWLPLVLLWLDQAIRRGSLLRATWAGAAFAAIVLGAYPYLTLYAGLFIALWTLGTALEQSGHYRTMTALVRWAGFGAWTALVAVALGAVQLLPSLEASANASRSVGVGVTWNVLTDAIQSLTGLVGPPLTDEPNPWENRAGLGILWLTCAVLAPLVAGRRARFEAGICLVLLAFVFGGSAVFQSLPGFRLFRLPSRMLLIAALPMALLVGRTVQAVLLPEGLHEVLRRQCRTVLVKITAGVLILAAVLALAVVTGRQDMHACFHPYWATLLVTVPGAYWLLGRPGGRSFQASAWVVILGIDLCSLTWSLVTVRPEADVFAPSACVRYLEEHRNQHGRVLDFNPEDRGANVTPLWPGLAAVRSIEPIRGFNPIDVLRYKEYLQFLTDADEPLQAIDGMFTTPVLGTFPVKNQALADLLGIRYLVQPSALPLENTVQDPTGRECWEAVMEDPAPATFNFIEAHAGAGDCGIQSLPPYRVYENSRVLPRAFVVSEAAPLPERDQVLPALKAADFRRRVLLENFTGQENSGQSRETASSDQDDFRPASVREYLPNRVALEVERGGAGFLVLTDIWFPGWTCTVDGQPAPIYRANFLFRAVKLPAGAREVVFTFAPASYAWGKTISGWAVAVVLGLSLLPILRHVPLSEKSKRIRRPDAVPS